MGDTITFDNNTIPITNVSFGDSEYQPGRFVYFDSDQPVFEFQDIGRKVNVVMSGTAEFTKKVRLLSQVYLDGKYKVTLQQEPELPPVL